MSSGGKGIGEMKAVILAGGRGSRISAESDLRPKPMITIGGKPSLIHIMNIYASQGVDEFIIALGYRAEVVKEYFLNFYALNNDPSRVLSYLHSNYLLGDDRRHREIKFILFILVFFSCSL